MKKRRIIVLAMIAVLAISLPFGAAAKVNLAEVSSESQMETEALKSQTEVGSKERQTETDISEGQTESDSKEIQTEAGAPQNQTETETPENQLEAGFSENQPETEALEGQTEAGPKENLMETEISENQTETVSKEQDETFESQIETELTESQTETGISETQTEAGSKENDEVSESQTESEASETQTERETTADQPETQVTETQMEVEIMEGQTESESADSQIDSEMLEDQTENMVLEDETEELDPAKEADTLDGEVSYIVSIPEKIDFGDLQIPENNTESHPKTVSFQVSAVQITGLDKSTSRVVVWMKDKTADLSKFVLTGTGAANTGKTLEYQVLKKNDAGNDINVTQGTSSSKGYELAGFSQAGESVAGTLYLEQNQMYGSSAEDLAGDYAGVISFYTEVEQNTLD